jgi:SAM-dependent methyltransferase
MLRLAHETLVGTSGQVTAATIEGWAYPATTADLVISRLALHYVENVDLTFRQTFKTLAPGGRLVFSVEHPVISSCNRALGDDGRRREWIVDDYHVSGRRVIRWLGKEVVKYHHTVEEFFGGLQRAGFTVEALREARPRREAFLREETYQRRLRIPLFLLLAARKPGAPFAAH